MSIKNCVSRTAGHVSGSGDRMIRGTHFPKIMTNVGFWLALLIWSVLGWRLGEHALFQGDFTVVGTQQECAQPLNNRCTPAYRVREHNGDEHLETLSSFLGEATVGSHIQKDRFSMSYRVNGRSTALSIDGAWGLAALLALVSFANAMYWAWRKKQP